MDGAENRRYYPLIFSYGILCVMLLLTACSAPQQSVQKSSTNYHSSMKQHLQTDNAPAPIGPYSQGIKAQGSLYYFSGQIALDLQGNIVGTSVQEQTHQVCKNIGALLSAQGLSFDNVVKTTVFLKDMGEFAAMNEVYTQYFNSSKPARSTVEVSRLPKDVRVEIEVIAVGDE